VRETNEGFPDISLLPRIAGYYHVSVDELLGVDEIAKQNRMKEIMTEYDRIRHHVPLDPDYHLDEGIELLRNAVKELPDDFFLEQLLAADLSWKGKNSTNANEKRTLFEEATVLCEDILARSTMEIWRSSANQILLVIYAELGESEKALEMAYQMPGPRSTCEYMLTYILQGEKLIGRYKRNAILYYKIFYESIVKLKEKGIKFEEMIDYPELSLAGLPENIFKDAIQSILHE